MRQFTKTATTQLGLFAASSQIQPLPREIDPKIVALLARLFRQHAKSKAAVAGLPEGGHE